MEDILKSYLNIKDLNKLREILFMDFKPFKKIFLLATLLSMEDPSSPTRDWTPATCIENAES